MVFRKLLFLNFGLVAASLLSITLLFHVAYFTILGSTSSTILFIILLLGAMFCMGVVSIRLIYSPNKTVKSMLASIGETIPIIFDQNLKKKSDEFHTLKDGILRMKDIIDEMKNDPANKKNTRNEILSVFKHELLTPLVPISGHAQMLSDKGFLGHLNKSQLESMEEISINVRKLEDIINKFLELQAVEKHLVTYNKNKTNIRNVTESLLSEIQRDMKNEPEIINRVPDELSVTTDGTCLKRVLKYLLDNSIDFVPADKGRIEVGAYPKDSNVIFYVKDNGIGIPKDKQGNIFKKFYQIDSSYTRTHIGMGLGLAICKGIIEGLGGKVWFESKQGEGTTFYFSIPA